MRSFNFKMVLNNVSQLKHIQLTKHITLQLHYNAVVGVHGKKMCYNGPRYIHATVVQNLLHYFIQKIYHIYLYTTQWNFIILRKFSHIDSYVIK